jgi:hypothetical protein
MANPARELFEEAMRLDPKERATLMRLIERRIAELDSGQIQAVSWEELRARLYQR